MSGGSVGLSRQRRARKPLGYKELRSVAPRHPATPRMRLDMKDC